MNVTEKKDERRLEEIKEKIERLTKYKVKDIKCINQDNKWLIETDIENYKNKFKIESIKNDLMLNYLVDEVITELKEEKQNS
jgi:hypothetical protein